MKSFWNNTGWKIAYWSIIGGAIMFVVAIFA